MSKYTIGIDYGTLSGRAVIVSLQDGTVLASKEYVYPHGVIDQTLPDTNIKLGTDWALQDPEDYLNVLKYAVPDVVQKSGVNPNDIIGIGVDFTSCTVIPIKEDLTPICKLPEFKDRPNAWVKLWKHHAAQCYADELNTVAHERNENFLQWYGGKISSEWFIPKVMQVLVEDPDIYDASDYFIEASEWIPAILTGKLHRTNCAAGYKCIWDDKTGYPSKEFFKALNPKLENFVEDKLPQDIFFVGDELGTLCQTAADLMQLPAGISVAVGVIDSHASMPAFGAIHAHDLVISMGTSMGHFINSEEKLPVDGICGCVLGGAIPTLYQYEAGQPASGDTLNWVVKNAVPPKYFQEAEQNNQDIFAYLGELASEIKPASSGLVALDWWNGNRSTLVDANLSGLLLGLTLNTTAPEIFRALVEASAFGTRYIIDTYERFNVQIDKIYACGGLSYKSPFWVQTFADILQKPIYVSAEQQAPAIGSSIYAAIAAGKSNGGYDTFEDACQNMKVEISKVYSPQTETKVAYDKLYAHYCELYQFFGTHSQIMKSLKADAIENKTSLH